MQKFLFKNNHLVTQKQGIISVNERGFLFGDGIFETCQIFNGKIYDYKAHESRIKSGLKALKFDADISNLQKKADLLIKKNSCQNGILRISLSRGIGSSGYLPLPNLKPLIIIQTLKKRRFPQKIAVGISKYTTPAKPLGKTMNALPYILTKIVARQKNLFDCIMLSAKKFIAQTSSANIFWVKNGQVFTPAASCDIVSGTVRRKILKISPVKIFETKAKLSTLKNADEIFLTNSAFLVLPVDNLADNVAGNFTDNFTDNFSGKKLQKEFAPKFLKLLQEDIKKSCQN
jgi:branched-subunit amino acid aminotransferase/4-amino-4-deoxychorismate lyase